MKDKIKIAVVGGDARQLAAAKELQADGYEVGLFGAEEGGLAVGVPRAGSLAECAAGAAAVVLGVPFSTDGRWINMRGGDCAVTLAALYELMAPKGLLLGGMITEEASRTAEQYGVKTRDYFAREEVAVLNTVPTAEGAIAIAMSLLSVTLDGAKAAVIGYGRIGSALAARLRALGAETTVAARSPVQRARCRVDGVGAVELESIEELSGSDVVFNTVPAPVLGEKELRLIGGAPIIDLASAPGGVDAEAARRLGCRVVQALALPGKVAPVTAGRIIKDAVTAILREEGIAP